MVARITTPKSLQKTLNYNENKVQKGSAVCIGESGFLLPHNKMNFYDKLELFEHRNRLNDRAHTKTLHVSLNFSNSESYSTAFYMQLAEEYMSLIGFGAQPFLVYQHKDAGHPHIHILSTTIRSDGTRINTHNLGRNQSEVARKELEEKYGLIKAENSTNAKAKIAPFDLQKVQYGKSETKQGIGSVLQQVLPTYNYTSLPELNAVLKQFNVMADRCAPDGFIYSKKGLYYRVLGDNGVRIGVPIKASQLPASPTLENLERRFKQNENLREHFKEKLRTKIEHAFLNDPKSISDLAIFLSHENVVTIRRENDDGKLYGITFVDNENRSVFNGSAIDRKFSVSGLLKMMNEPSQKRQRNDSSNYSKTFKAAETGFIEFNGLSPLAALISPETEFNPTPYQLKRKKKKRRR